MVAGREVTKPRELPDPEKIMRENRAKQRAERNRDLEERAEAREAALSAAFAGKVFDGGTTGVGAAFDAAVRGGGGRVLIKFF